MQICSFYLYKAGTKNLTLEDKFICIEIQIMFKVYIHTFTVKTWSHIIEDKLNSEQTIPSFEHIHNIKTHIYFNNTSSAVLILD